MTNVLWIIGFLGGQTAYLNITQEEAERRYRLEHDGFLDGVVKKLEFNDSFESYDISHADYVDAITKDAPGLQYPVAPAPPKTLTPQESVDWAFASPMATKPPEPVRPPMVEIKEGQIGDKSFGDKLADAIFGKR